MIKLHQGSRTRFVEMAVRLPVLDYTHATDMYTLGFGHADIITDLLSSYLVPCGVIDPDRLFGETSTNEIDTSFTARGCIPIPKQYNYLEDVVKYGTSLSAAFDVLSGSNKVVPKFENLVFHTSIEGEVRRFSSPLYTYTDERTGVFVGHRMPIPDQTFVDGSGIYQYGPTIYPTPPQFSSPFVPYIGRTPIIGLISRFGGFLHGLGTKAVETDAVGYFSNWETFRPGSIGIPPESSRHPVYGLLFGGGAYACTDVVVGKNEIRYTSYLASTSLMRESKIVLRYHVERDPNFVGTWYYPSPFRVVAAFDIQSRYFVPEPDVQNEFYGWRLVNPDSPVSNRSCEIRVEGFGTNWIYSDVGRSSYHVPDLLKSNESQTLHAYENLVLEELGTFRPAIMKSYNDAISQFRAVSGDYLEVVYQYEKLFKLVPDVNSYLKIGYEVWNGQYGTAARHVIKALAGLKLSFTFGFNKMVGNVSEITNAIDSVTAALERLSAPMTVHGQHRHVFSGELLGLVNPELVVRTKIRLSGINDGLLLNLLKLDSLGLTPRPSHLWDLVPFSWLIDFFTGLGDRYEVIDSVLIGLMLGTEYCVHSMTIKHVLPAEVLASQGLSSITDVEVIHYAREVSTLVPTIFKSDVDFGQPSKPPNLTIIAALLVSLFGGDSADGADVHPFRSH